MDTEERLPAPNGVSPFERIRRTDAAGAEYWSSRDFAQVLGYSDYRSFEQAMKRAKTAWFNSGQRVGDHFGEITEMVLDLLAAVETGGLRPFHHLLEIAVVRVPEDLGKVAAGPEFRSGGIGTAGSLEGRDAVGHRESFLCVHKASYQCHHCNDGPYRRQV